MRFNSPLTGSSPRIAAVLLGCCVLAPAWSDADLGSRSINLEIIVKFSPDSDTGRRVDRILEKNPINLSGLSELQGSLQRLTGFELIPDRITSGREVIFRIPEKPLLEKVEQT